MRVANKKASQFCNGRHIRAEALDEIVPTNLKQRVLAPDRIAELLKSLIERQAAKSESADDRLVALPKELTDCEDRMKRLYRSIEDGIVELDDILRERTAALKAQRERAKMALDHARAQCGTAAAVNAEKTDPFARLMKAKLDASDINTRKAISARSSTRVRSMTKPFGSSAAGICYKPPYRPRTEIF